MAIVDQRTLAIISKVIDQVSAPFAQIARNVKGQITNVMAPAFRGLSTLSAGLQKQLGVGLGGLAAGFGLFKITGKIREAIDQAAHLKELSDAFHTTTESISELGYAFSQMGASQEDAAQALGRTVKLVGQLQRGAGEDAAKAIYELGLSVGTLTSADKVEAFAMIAKKVMEIEDEAKRADYSFRIWGKGVGEKLLPVLAGSGKELDQFRKRAKDLNLIVSSDQAKVFDEWKDQIAELDAAFSSLGRNVGALAIPPLTTLARVLSEIIAEIPKLPKDFWDVVSGKAAKDTRAALDKKMGEVKQWSPEAWAKLSQADKDRALRMAFADQGMKDLRPEYANENYSDLRALRDAKRTGGYDMPWLTELQGNLEAKKKMEGRTGGYDFPLIDQMLGQAKSGSGTKDLDKTAEIVKGLGEGISKAADEWTDFKKQGVEAGEAIVNQGLSKITDELAMATLRQKSWKQAAKDWGKAMIEMLTRIIIQLAIVRALGGLGLGGAPASTSTGDFPSMAAGTTYLGTFARGGVTKGALVGSMPVRRFALGGVANEPTVGIFGEAGAEAFVPLASGKIPVRVQGGTGGHTSLHFHITAMDGKDVRRVLIEQRQTLMSLWQNDVAHINEARKSVKGVR